MMDEEAAAQQFEYLMDWSETNAWEHYEISNLCQPGFHSRHNSAYWQGKPYLGLGPSAHAYLPHTRYHNPPDMFMYCKKMAMNQLCSEAEPLSETDRYHEQVMIGLRLAKGLNSDELLHNQSEQTKQHFLQVVAKHREAGHLTTDNHQVVLTRKGKLLADSIIRDFFI